MAFILRISEKQVKKQSQKGRFLGALAGLINKTIIPLASKFIPKITAALATGVSTSVGDIAMKNIVEQGVINVTNDNRSI